MTETMRSNDSEAAGESASDGSVRVEVRGKFLWVGATKFFLRGVAYGPFPPDAMGSPFPSAEQIQQDFALMRQAGINAIRTYDVPPQRLLDLAQQWSIRVLVGIPWAQHLCFLDDRRITRDIRASVARAVRFCSGHPSVLAYVVGNEVPSPIVRWHGAQKVSRFLAQLSDTAKSIDPFGLVTYANYPPTEYLETEFVDFYAFNVYLHEPAAYRRYLARLHNLAGDRPLVLSEFGMDVIRYGEAQQADTLAWQVRSAFEMGAAGTVVFTWTDEWFTGGYPITDWAFGLVRADRAPRRAYYAVQAAYQAPCPPLPDDPPKISVVVCAYNAEATMRECLESLTKLAYPKYEAVIVDDGSTDRTGAIADEYPQFKVIHQPNRGLSVARNVGLAAAGGEIVAYLDADAVADPDWLTYMAWKFRTTSHAGIGGPNLPPPEDDWLAACIAAAPGSPTHILLDDETAEHIPGCNMAFRKQALEEIGGFDPTYAAAGDDVDICWRLQDHGWTVGYSPAAMVWHHRRKTVRSYLRQQMGYGRAEAMLFRKHPGKFNALGTAKWAGRIYGGIRAGLALSRGCIYYGPFGSGLFQRVYHSPHSWLADFPLSLEWNVLTALLLLGGFLSPSFLIAGLLSGLTTLWTVVQQAVNTPVPVSQRRWLGRLLVAALHYLQPIARGWARVRRLLWEQAQPQRTTAWHRVVREAMRWPWRRQRTLAYWTENGLQKEALLYPLWQRLRAAGYPAMTDTGWQAWDLSIDEQPWSRIPIAVVVENHGGPKRLARLRVSWRFTPLAKGVLWACAGLVGLGLLEAQPWLVGTAGLALVAGVIWVAYRSAAVIQRTCQLAREVAATLALMPLNGQGGKPALHR
jgi:cellulose synthase/poly-beta-1,6-N-acetylglucosamine synthase-like glycosyltransferase